MEIARRFKKDERSYHSTPNGWRLATVEEAKNGLESIKEQQVLKEWDRARLLDGWISGSGHDFEIKNEFRGCMGYMLLIETQKSEEDESGTPYADVNLSELGKEVALLLCVDDWNLEVVYWLLNSWSKSDTMMKLSDVRGGNVPFTNAARFKKMNKGIGRLARKLAVEEVAAREKGRTTKYSGTDSVKEVLMGMKKIVTEEEQITGYQMRVFLGYGGGEYFLPEFVQTRGDVAEAFWSFVCETFAGCVVEVLAFKSLENIRSMKTRRSSKKNWVIATSLLLSLSDYRSDIIHEPLKHKCTNNCAGEFLSDVEEKAGGNPDRFSEMLKHNAMWRCYDKTGNYGVISKLLFSILVYRKTEIFIAAAADILLKCGAEPAGCYAIHTDLKNTTLHNAAEFEDKDVSREVAKLLLERCDVESRSHFVNKANAKGMTALHIASQNGNARLCELLVEFNASVDAKDSKGMTPLHSSLEGEGAGEVINFLMERPEVTELVDLKDTRDYTPINIAIANKDYASTAKLLSKSKDPEAYLSEVDQEQLLRCSLLFGSPDIVEKLYEKGVKLPAGDCDEDRKTALHLAAMRDDEKSAKHIIKFILSRLSTPGQDKTLVAERDRRGRTVLHEAALNGYQNLCKFLLGIDPKLLSMKDRDRRNPLFDLVKGKYKRPPRIITLLTGRVPLLKEWVEKDMPLEELIDRSGLTPLHVAVSQGKLEIVEELLSSDKFKEKYISRGDFLAQTALHKAAKRGDLSTVDILLEHGVHPLKERDCDGRTALHYALQAEIGDKKELVNALFNRCESEDEQALLLWASAAGLGTADKSLSNNDPLREILLQKKRDIEKKDTNLLRMAACVGDIEMTKELIIRGYQIGDILDDDWRTRLVDERSQANVKRVSKQIDMIKELGNDKPARSDALGRLDYAQGLAALFLNPYIKPPIAVGITGTWGMGKSSLMVQTEQILLTTAAQMALLESSKLPSSALELPGIKYNKLSSKGKRKCKSIYKQIRHGESTNKNLSVEKIQEELKSFLNKYDSKHRKVFKSLAAMDTTATFESNSVRPKTYPPAEETVPAILTVQYNAWKYRNDTEALAGMAVEITKELEGVMTQAKWLSTCCRYSWKNKKRSLWIEIFFPSLLALVLVSSFTWIIWVALDSDKFKEWVKAKYAWPPAAMVIIVWTLTRSVMGVLKPVSTQLMQSVSFPDHTDKLGYQGRVISDITFLKEEIGKNAFWVFIVFSWFFTAFTGLWGLITQLWVTSLLSHRRNLAKAIDAPKVTSASGSDLRIIVFVDDLDRCQESVILQVLSAINIVLAECEINVVMGMDKRLIQRAILKKYGDGKGNRSQELADMYLQKIIQLPLDLPDPSREQSTRFLKRQLGVLETGDSAPAPGDEKSDLPAIFISDDADSSRTDERGDAAAPDLSEEEFDDADSNGVGGEGETQVLINMPPTTEISEKGPNNLPEPVERTASSSGGEIYLQSASEMSSLKCFKSLVRNIVRYGKQAFQALRKAKFPTGSTNFAETIGPTEPRSQTPSQTGIQQNPSSSILIREMLFVRYSQGEENAFLYFQELVTESRKLPREWKRLLNYHRLVWYIFSLSEEAKTLAGWQVQMITWIFVCWEWQDHMNLIIEKWKDMKWKEMRDLKTSESNEPSLLTIVEHLMEENERENKKMTVIGNEEDGPKINNKEETETEISKRELENLNKNRDVGETMEKDTSQELVKVMNKLEAIEKSFGELKKEMKNIKEPISDGSKEEMKELIKQVSNELKEEMQELKKQVSDELKKDINEIREQMVKKQNNKDERNMETKKIKLHNLENWKRMKSTLERYDVPMDGIQAFQRFRFYCMSGYLPRPLLKDQRQYISS